MTTMNVKRISMWILLLLGLANLNLVGGRIVINEIMLNSPRAKDTSTQWFELYNTEGTARSLFDWNICYRVDYGNDFDDSIDAYTCVNLRPTKSIPAFGYMVIGNNANKETNGGVDVDISINFIETFPKDGRGQNIIAIVRPLPRPGVLDESFVDDGVFWDSSSLAADERFPFPSLGNSPSSSIYKVNSVETEQTASNWRQSSTYINCDPFNNDRGTPGKINTYVCKDKTCGLLRLSIFCLNGCGIFGRLLNFCSDE